MLRARPNLARHWIACPCSTQAIHSTSASFVHLSHRRPKISTLVPNHASLAMRIITSTRDWIETLICHVGPWPKPRCFREHSIHMCCAVPLFTLAPRPCQRFGLARFRGVHDDPTLPLLFEFARCWGVQGQPCQCCGFARCWGLHFGSSAMPALYV